MEAKKKSNTVNVFIVIAVTGWVFFIILFFLVILKCF